MEFQFFTGVKTSNDCNYEYHEEKNSIISLICVSMTIVVPKTTSNNNDYHFLISPFLKLSCSLGYIMQANTYPFGLIHVVDFWNYHCTRRVITSLKLR